MRKTPEVRIVILNYRGADLLPQCLPSVVDAARKATYPTRVTVLDNPSPDDGLSYVEMHFPQVAIERSPENKILCSYNGYLPKVAEPIVILLNNDIRVAPDFVDPLIGKFLEDERTFLVAPRVMNFDGTRLEAGRSKAGVRFGFFWCDARYRGYENEALKPSETYSSGFGAFSREKFLSLGGYKELYLPGILEDVDLSYQAHKAGYGLYYEPRSVVYHKGQASFKKVYGVSETAVIAHRNNFLFMWKNFSGASFWLKHLFFLPLRLVFSLCRGNRAMGIGFWRALGLSLGG